MKIGVYQFSSTNSIRNNLETIKKAICLAAGQGVRLVVFHECALCGYQRNSPAGPIQYH